MPQFAGLLGPTVLLAGADGSIVGDEISLVAAPAQLPKKKTFEMLQEAPAAIKLQLHIVVPG